MACLVIAEHDNSAIKPSTLNTVAAATRIGGDVHVIVLGSGCEAAAKAAAQIAGVSKVLLADAAPLADGLAENVAEQILAVAGSYSHILAPATAFGKNATPRIAAKLDVAQISDITSVESAGHVHPSDLRRQRDRHRAVGRQGQGDHRAHHRFRCGGGQRRVGRGRVGQARSPIPASPRSCRGRSPSSTVRN